MNYRSVMVFGTASVVDDPEKKLEVLHGLTDHLIRGRWEEIRQPSPEELRRTLILAIPIDEASAKIRVGPPIDEEEDYALPVWAGVLPLQLTAWSRCPIRGSRPGQGARLRHVFQRTQGRVMKPAVDPQENPLLLPTPLEWAGLALRDPLALLNDHAYLEKKAATNALELLNRWPEPSCPDEWTPTLAAIAADEATHLARSSGSWSNAAAGSSAPTATTTLAACRLHVRKGTGDRNWWIDC